MSIYCLPIAVSQSITLIEARLHFTTIKNICMTYQLKLFDIYTQETYITLTIDDRCYSICFVDDP